MKTFTAIDFETAQGYRWSICQIGLVRIVEGKEIARISILVQPPFNYYWHRFSEIHGITREDTKCAPPFSDAWPAIQPYIAGQLVVAHNSKFDFGCLRSTLDFYGIAMPEFSG